MEKLPATKKIPSFNELRINKAVYRTLPIDDNSELYNEPCFGIYEFGISGQSYYSRKNPLTIEPIDSVPKEPILRKTVVDKLALLNEKIRQDVGLKNIFGGSVELYVEEGTRLLEVQKRLYDIEFPKLIRQQYPGITSQELVQKLADLIAKPTLDEKSPSPHATGSAFDVCLRFAEDQQGLVDGQKEVKLRRFDGDTSEANYPDYFENPENIQSENDLQIMQNRRLLYSLMTGEYFGYETGFACNPTEWWHWSYGDQLWAFVSNNSSAYYSLAK